MATWGDLYKIDRKEIDWTQNRIQPFVEFKMPDVFTQEEYYEQEEFYIAGNMNNEYDIKKRTVSVQTNGWVRFSLGVFLVATPKKKESANTVEREIEGYDKLLILLEDKLTDRLTFDEGTSYYDAMVQVLDSAGVTKYSLENSGKALETTKEFEPGMEKLRVLNELASELNFSQFWVDEYGYFRTEKYTPPHDRGIDYEYLDDEISVTFIGSEEELDLYDLPNVWHVTVSNPDKEPLSATYENHNRDHPRSIENLERRIVRYEEKNDIADLEALKAYVERLAVEASQIYSKVTMKTAIMPFHGYSNTLRIRNQTLGIDAKYSETDWKIPLQAGGEMEHKLRRSVAL